MRANQLEVNDLSHSKLSTRDGRHRRRGWQHMAHLAAVYVAYQTNEIKKRRVFSDVEVLGYDSAILIPGCDLEFC